MKGQDRESMQNKGNDMNDYCRFKFIQLLVINEYALYAETLNSGGGLCIYIPRAF